MSYMGLEERERGRDYELHGFRGERKGRDYGFREERYFELYFSNDSFSSPRVLVTCINGSQEVRTREMMF